MNTVNIFEQASKTKLRFDTSRGELTVEQLWDLPLTSDRANALTLDGIAREVNKELKGVTEESFVPTKPNPQAAQLTLALDILKHIIADKVAAAEAAKEAAARKIKRDRLIGLLDKKQEMADENLSVEDIKKQLEELN